MEAGITCHVTNVCLLAARSLLSKHMSQLLISESVSRNMAELSGTGKFSFCWCLLANQVCQQKWPSEVEGSWGQQETYNGPYSALVLPFQPLPGPENHGETSYMCITYIFILWARVYSQWALCCWGRGDLVWSLYGESLNLQLLIHSLRAQGKRM